jgi:hypothetical protein
MQVSATLIAAQQAAREAQARFHAAHVAPANKPPVQAGFSAALEQTGTFSPLPLKQTAASPTPAQPAPSAPQTGRPGSLLDIRV